MKSAGLKIHELQATVKDQQEPATIAGYLFWHTEQANQLVRAFGEKTDDDSNPVGLAAWMNSHLKHDCVFVALYK